MEQKGTLKYRKVQRTPAIRSKPTNPPHGDTHHRQGRKRKLYA